jgi:hypothetical protein
MIDFVDGNHLKMLKLQYLHLHLYQRCGLQYLDFLHIFPSSLKRMVLNLQGEEQLLLDYPNEYVVHEILELQRELSDLSKQVSLPQINQIGDG